MATANQSQKQHPWSLKTRTRIVTTTLLVAALAITLWYFLGAERTTLGEKPFVVLKMWSDKPSASGQMSAGYEWIHRQCHESLVDVTPDGRLEKRGAAEVSRLGDREWKFKIRPDSKWSDDGKPITVQDYVRAWDLRRGLVTDEKFKRIKNVKSIDTTNIAIELEGDQDTKLDYETLSSIWLSPIKSTTVGSWNYSRELEGPCDGPYVLASLSKKEALLARNKYWRSYDAEMIKYVKVLLSDDLSKSTEAPAELFDNGLLSFVEPNHTSNSVSTITAVKGRVFLESKAHYLVVNPRGLLGGPLIAFAHAAMNRGELSALISRPQTLSNMHRVLPLSFVVYDDTGKPIYLPPRNLESVANANKVLGINSDKVMSKKLSPFKRKLVVIGSHTPELEPVVQRFSDRIGANYNISTEIMNVPDDGTLPTAWDVAFVDITWKDGVRGWALEMVKMLTHYIPGKTDLISKFNSLAAEKTEGPVTKKILDTCIEIDSLAPKSLVIVPLGQLGSEILLEDGVMDVSWVGDTKRDPDVSRARRLKRDSRG